MNILINRIITGFGEDVKKTKAVIEVDDPLPAIWADSRILEQVMINLISNALKFVAPGVSPLIRVWAERLDGKVRICVKDNGIGIAPEYHERVFKVFERLHGDEENYPGTGIGLAIVQKGMERLQGRAGVISRPGEGSCFWLELDSDKPQTSA